MAYLEEVLMGLGDWSLDLDWDPALLGDLAYYSHLLLYQGERHIYTGVLTRRKPSRWGITIGGRSLEWWTGLDSNGPTIVDRELISGRDKMYNGNLQFGEQYFARGEGSLWAFDGELGTSGDLTKDDVLFADQSDPAKAGDVFRTSVRSQRTNGSIGRLRLRTIYEGRFDHPNLLPAPGFEGGTGWANASDFADDVEVLNDAGEAHSGSWVARAGPVTKPQLLLNQGFESGAGVGWGTATYLSIVNDPVNARAGSWVMRLIPIVRPQLLGNFGFESGAGASWGSATYFAIVNSPANARSGSWALRAAPVTRPQLLANFGFEGGATGWGTVPYLVVTNAGVGAYAGSYALLAWPIPKPQLLANYGFESGAGVGWGTSALGFLAIRNFAPGARTGTWMLLAQPIPRAQLLGNPDFESGASGWSGSAGDLTVVTDAGNAFSGSNVLKAGPSSRPQLVGNPGFEGGLTNWTQVAGTWYQDANSHFEGAYSATTAGGGPTLKHMRYANLAVVAGERYRYELKIRATQDSGAFDGVGHASLLMLDSGSVASHWVTTPRIAAGEGAPGVDWQSLVIEFEVPEGIAYVQPNVVVESHTVGWWSFDAVKLIKLSGNTDEISATAVTVDSEQSYELSAMMRTGPGYQGGEASIRVRFTAAGQPDQVEQTFRQGNTKNQWVRVATSVRPPAGYTTAQVSVLIRDVAGDSVWVDRILLEKTNGNSEEITATAVTVEPEQAYEMSAYVRSPFINKGGGVQLRAKLSGSGQPDQYVDSPRQGHTKDKWVRVATSVRPPEGYTSCTVSVIAEDIVGGDFYIDEVGLEKSNNNTAENPATAVTVAAEQNYELSAYIRSGPNLKGGDVVIRAKLSGSGVPDQYVDTSRQANTKNQWVRVATMVRPPEGYTTATVSVLSRDVVGDYFFIDNVALEKADGNTDEVFATAVTVTPQQSYDLSAMVRSGPAVKAGRLTLRAKLSGPGGPDQYVETSTGTTKNQWVRLATTFRPPSGYTTATVSVIQTDIVGDYFWVDEVAVEKADGNTDRIEASTTYAVVPDTRYQLSATVRSGTNLKRGSTTIGVRLEGSGLPDQIVQTTQGATANAWAQEWTQVLLEFRPASGYVTAVPFVAGTDIDGDNFWLDDLKLIKVDNNRGVLTSTAMSVTPERTYKLSGFVRSGPALQQGSVQLDVTFQGAGRPDMVFSGQSMSNTETVWKVLSSDFTPPSGYDSAMVSVVGLDVEGDSYWVDDLSFVDTDASTKIFDHLIGPGLSGFTTYTQDTTAPTGTESVRVAVVAESQGRGYGVSELHLVRVAPTITSAEVFEMCLVNPRTERGFATPGQVSGAEVIQYDYHVQLMTLRQLLTVLARKGLGLPVREWRFNPDRTADFGTAAELFESRDSIFAERDLFLLEEPELEGSAEDAVTEVRVIGAERQRADGSQEALVGEAENAASGLDWDGYPVERTLVVQDASLNHPDFATAWARYEADRAANPAEAIELQLSEMRALEDFDVGDWLNVYQPEAGIEDPSRPMQHEGRTVFPHLIRVLSRRRVLGDGSYRAELRLAGGRIIDITDAVRWAPRTTTTVTVGDALPEFATDPQGGPALVQFMRARAAGSI